MKIDILCAKCFDLMKSLTVPGRGYQKVKAGVCGSCAEWIGEPPDRGDGVAMRCVR